jgi:hypothetical protein
MSGGLVVEGSDRLYPILSGLPEHFFFIKHAELGEGNEIISINGQLNPLVDIRPGEMQFWRIAHIGATLFIKFRITGMPLYVVNDGDCRAREERRARIGRCLRQADEASQGARALGVVLAQAG